MSEVCDKCLTCHWYSDDVLDECQGQEQPCHEYSAGIEYKQWRLKGIANGWIDGKKRRMEKFIKYKIGQILTSNQEIVVERVLSGEKVTIPKGNRIIIGADKLAHHIKDGMIQPLADDSEVEGYDNSGIAEYIYMCLKTHLPIDKWMEDYEISGNEIIEEIECALDEIGIC